VKERIDKKAEMGNRAVLMWVLENDRSKVEKIEKDMSIARHVM
jgi:hypothetical protein